MCVYNRLLKCYDFGSSPGKSSWGLAAFDDVAGGGRWQGLTVWPLSCGNWSAQNGGDPKWVVYNGWLMKNPNLFDGWKRFLYPRFFSKPPNMSGLVLFSRKKHINWWKLVPQFAKNWLQNGDVEVLIRRLSSPRSWEICTAQGHCTWPRCAVTWR